MWDRNCELCWGVGQVSEMWGSMGKVWKGVWGECGGCVKVGKSVLGCGAVWGCGGANTLFYPSTHILHTHPTPLPTLTPHLSSAPPHVSPNTSLHTFPHSPPNLSHTSPHPSHLSFIPPNTFPHSLPILPHNPHASSNTSLCSLYFIIYPMLEFLTFLFYCQISLTIK